jgi:hypothetical protein
VDYIRTHDVAALHDALTVHNAIATAGREAHPRFQAIAPRG